MAKNISKELIITHAGNYNNKNENKMLVNRIQLLETILNEQMIINLNKYLFILISFCFIIIIFFVCLL